MRRSQRENRGSELRFGISEQAGKKKRVAVLAGGSQDHQKFEIPELRKEQGISLTQIMIGGSDVSAVV